MSSVQILQQQQHMKLQYLTKYYVKIVTPIVRLVILHQLPVKLVKMDNI